MSRRCDDHSESLPDMPDKPEATCPECGAIFPARSNKRFCSASCRKASSQKKRRAKTPVNATHSKQCRRDQHELFNLAMRMAETLYTMPPFERLGYLEEIVQLARSGRCKKTKKVLTMPALLYPDP